MKTKVTQTSIDAYRELEASGAKETKESKCLAEIRRQKKTTRRKLKRALKWEANQVSGRVNGLINKGLVKVVGKELDPITKVNVQLLEAVQ